MEIKNIEDGEYTSKGEFTFTTKEGNEIEMKAVDALEIAYTLFDWANMPYELLDEINEKVEG